MRKNSLVFVFLDGFGLGEPSEKNPLFTTGIPSLEQRIGARLLKGCNVFSSSVLTRGIDACLGINGLPQSATGQTTLLTGINAPKTLGYHLPAFPNSGLIEMIQKHSLLKRAAEMGLKVTFANAYTDSYFEKAAQGRAQQSVTTHCLLAAGLQFRTLEDLRNNNAVYWDITRHYLRDTVDASWDVINPYDAGHHLTTLAHTHDLVLYESFLSDLIGHKTDLHLAENLLYSLDLFFRGILSSLSSETSLLICSDHGNIEDMDVGTHTRNPVPLIVLGPAAPCFAEVTSLHQVSGAVLNALSIPIESEPISSP